MLQLQTETLTLVWARGNCYVSHELCFFTIRVEPTANVDSNTDRLLQKTLTERFSGPAIISIAHRLDTNIDYDRILVTPSKLLSKKYGEKYGGCDGKNYCLLEPKG